eukprot:760246-Hanusia_phi.AAC.1
MDCCYFTAHREAEEGGHRKEGGGNLVGHDGSPASRYSMSLFDVEAIHRTFLHLEGTDRQFQQGHPLLTSESARSPVTSSTRSMRGRSLSQHVHFSSPSILSLPLSSTLPSARPRPSPCSGNGRPLRMSAVSAVGSLVAVHLHV